MVPFPGHATSARLTLFLRAAGLGVFLALAACEPIQYGPEAPKPPGDSTASGQASLILTNNREVDPGDLTFLLYRPAAQSIEDGTPAQKLGPVKFRSSATFKVPAGQWKIGYETENSVLRQMPSSDDEGSQAEWPVVILSAGKAYSLEIKTDEGGVIVWSHNLTLAKP